MCWEHGNDHKGCRVLLGEVGLVERRPGARTQTRAWVRVSTLPQPQIFPCTMETRPTSPSLQEGGVSCHGLGLQAPTLHETLVCRGTGRSAPSLPASPVLPVAFEPSCWARGCLQAGPGKSLLPAPSVFHSHLLLPTLRPPDLLPDGRECDWAAHELHGHPTWLLAGGHPHPPAPQGHCPSLAQLLPLPDALPAVPVPAVPGHPPGPMHR